MRVLIDAVMIERNDLWKEATAKKIDKKVDIRHPGTLQKGRIATDV